jgi:hypothetical protein
MSDMKPNKFGHRGSQANTAQAELRIANADAGLEWKGNDFQVIGQANPGSFSPNPAMDKVQNRQGVTSVATQQFMSSRDSAFSITLDEDTARAKQLANGTDLPPVFTPATTGFTLGTIGAGSTIEKLVVTGAQAAGLTTDHLLLVKHNAGDPLLEMEEERYVKKVSGDDVTLRNRLSKAPPDGDTVQRLAYYHVPDGGTNYEDLHVNIKNTLYDKSLNVLDYPLCNIETGKKNPGANNALRGVELTFTALAQAETISGAEEPVFGRDYLVPRKEVASLGE